MAVAELNLLRLLDYKHCFPWALPIDLVKQFCSTLALYIGQQNPSAISQNEVMDNKIFGRRVHSQKFSSVGIDLLSWEGQAVGNISSFSYRFYQETLSRKFHQESSEPSISYQINCFTPYSCETLPNVYLLEGLATKCWKSELRWRSRVFLKHIFFFKRCNFMS